MVGKAGMVVVEVKGGFEIMGAASGWNMYEGSDGDWEWRFAFFA